MTSGKTIGDNIKKMRAKLGLTQDDLAKKADIKYTTLTNIESGVVNKPSGQNRQSSWRFNRGVNQVEDMKYKPPIAYLIIIALLSAVFILLMKLLGQKGYYLASLYMLGPAIAAIITRMFFYEKKFKDAHLKLGRVRDYVSRGTNYF